MKRAVLTVLVVVAASLAVAGVVAAQNFRGTDGPDLLRGRPGNDTLYGGDGNDVMWPGSGQDTQYGGEGDDTLHALANDNQVDTLDCGPGNDTAIINVKEKNIDQTVSCETVKYVKL